MTSIQNFFAELKRRNVVRAGAAYVVLAWLVIQVADILFETFAVPNWVMQALVIALAIGLPIVLVGAWVYELTREGLKRTKEVELAESITFQTRRKLDFVIAGVLITAVAIFAVDKFVLQPGNAERNYTLAVMPFYTLAVMPFEIVSSDVAPFFAQLSGDLVRILKRSSQMRLASTDAVDALPDIRDAVASSARLGVRYLISGSISSSAGSVGLKVSIFDSDSGKQVWQRDFENAHSQATLNSVATELITAIDGDPFALPAVASDPKAYELYLQARRRRGGEAVPECARDGPAVCAGIGGIVRFTGIALRQEERIGGFRGGREILPSGVDDRPLLSGSTASDRQPVFRERADRQGARSLRIRTLDYSGRPPDSS
jgi:TolB-like protein